MKYDFFLKFDDDVEIIVVVVVAVFVFVRILIMGLVFYCRRLNINL